MEGLGNVGGYNEKVKFKSPTDDHSQIVLILSWQQHQSAKLSWIVQGLIFVK